MTWVEENAVLKKSLWWVFFHKCVLIKIIYFHKIIKEFPGNVSGSNTGQRTYTGSVLPHFVISKSVSKENLYFLKLHSTT